MKGGILGYVSILAILIAGTAVIIFTTQAGPVEEIVATKEGMLASSGNFNYFLLKVFDQSVEFISQRTAYDLGNYGGFIKGNEVFWTFYYPQISDLDKNLERRIEDTLPSFYKKFNRVVNLDDIDIRIDAQLPLETSKYFDDIGDANLSVYDDAVRARTFMHHEINSRAYSSYFRLLYVGREILTNETFNSSLNDINNLLIKLNNDDCFKDLNFIITSSDDIVYITIEDKCYPPNTYCLAPLYPDEARILKDALTLDPIPYDHIKLKFKTKAEQTGVTPSVCDFSIELDPLMGSVEAGDEVIPPVLVKVKNLGSTDDIVGLSATVYDKATMNIDATITVDFAENNKKMSEYPTFMKIKTKSSTLSGNYLIEVKGEGCTSIERVKDYDLTVNPSMTFSINVDPDPVKIIREIGYSNTTNMIVTKTGGSSKDVHLYFDSLPAGISRTFSQNDIPPDFVSVLTITTDGTTPAGTHTMTVKGIGGGSYVEKQFNLIVEEPFDFDFYFTGKDKDEIYPTQDTSTTMAVETTQGTPEPVSFSYNVIEQALGPDPFGNDYYITAIIVPNPCSLSVAVPDCYPTMDIYTTKDTLPGNYTVYINGSTTKVWHQISFDLKVKEPECFDIGVIPSIDCISLKGATSSCKYWECVNFECQEKPYPADYDPAGLCGTEPCGDKCEKDTVDGKDKEYRNPPSPTYDRVCDGLGNCNMTYDITKCIYNIWECRYGCKNSTHCWGGKWYQETTCTGGTGFGCFVGGTSVTISAQCKREDKPKPTGTYQYSYNPLFPCVLFGCAPFEACTFGFPAHCCSGTLTCTAAYPGLSHMDLGCKYLFCEPDLGEVEGSNSVCTDSFECVGSPYFGYVFITSSSIDLGCPIGINLGCCLY
jgi:hypothetical protein